MEPVSGGPITTTPAPPDLPWDATRTGAVGRWQECTSGPANINTGRQEGGDFPDSGVWKQT